VSCGSSLRPPQGGRRARETIAPCMRQRPVRVTLSRTPFTVVQALRNWQEPPASGTARLAGMLGAGLIAFGASSSPAPKAAPLFFGGGRRHSPPCASVRVPRRRGCAAPAAVRADPALSAAGLRGPPSALQPAHNPPNRPAKGQGNRAVPLAGG